MSHDVALRTPRHQELARPTAPREAEPSDVFEKQSLATIRRNAVAYIAANFKTPSGRRAAVEELAAILQYIAYERKEAAARRMQEQAITHKLRLLSVIEGHRRARVREEKQAQVASAKANLQLLGILADIRKLTPATPKDARAVLEAGKADLARLKAEEATRRLHQEAVLNRAKAQTLRRAEFRRYAHKHYPDLEEEMLDEFDRNVFAETQEDPAEGLGK